jgi:hypothetical protein
VTSTLRVFVDEQPVEVPTGSTVMDAVQAFASDVADSVRGGTAYVTDGVGRATDVSRQIAQGEILRVVKTIAR